MLQNASASEGRPDIASIIVASMRRMGVVGLPRNYEIFYEVANGSNRELSDAFASLGPRPTQSALDELSRRYFTLSSRQSLVESAQEQVADRAGEILGLLGRERSSLEKFGLILDQTSGGLGTRHEISRDLLQRIVAIMASATQATLEQGRQIAAAMAEKTAELETVKARLEEYKRLADTDPLTRVWNRRAFDRRLAMIYADTRTAPLNVLVLADIDNFKAFNDRYGHPIGDRILQKVAQLIEARCGGEGFVARTGGEEFAVILEGHSENSAQELAEHLREAVASARFPNGPTSRDYGPISISLGLCSAGDAADAEELYAKADRALYSSKVSGRDRVTCFSRIAAGKLSKKWLLYQSG